MQNFARKEAPELLSLLGVSHCYRRGKNVIPILIDVNLVIRRGHTCALVGASGSGKSTLLNMLGLLEKPTGGVLTFKGHSVQNADADQLAHLRNREIGFVFQSFNLLPRLSVVDNVALPLSYRGVSRRQARRLALEQLALVGLADRAHCKPADLSGGQRQRVAIARALVGCPALVLADEPTGNLDSQTAKDIMALLLGLNREHGVTLVMVTHDVELAKQFDRRIQVIDGELHEEGAHGQP
ncbi:ABC transporter ATP-binding protein [Pseudomonas sp. CCI3.2]|uniref:ABC transporter ATP-binding protein n=1 Tax=unclassified Pseudomonas TaxID=196821 RepID=UPI002AC921F3|nr:MULTISPECIES: ABC transporter ATP-binding protein [unclassified Pseudomonas]MEB0075814.1 ABC transporter ATP-binding protein [Pseudomonas sp. MH10out]MEB0091716.1 ABC transporter ATP-binding protein [Pseudomonas sp. CCI4.2]MEB0102788.1 ABC transporter ATP-binding protein [Pseudomonas sp. CCI3.2]MEB0131568.1 ABC transporter ATP-binding protein [Pseudomonas sp. CCI2.4]MEB0156461.1 ABC transporter ATP-binding protein [Pseudomonas sp. AH2 (2023)]